MAGAPCLTFALAVACFSALGAFAADAPAPASNQGFDAFKLVRARNIFDPERRAMVQESANRPPPSPSRPDSISLTGTMVAEGKKLAFFTGSRSDYNKVIGVRDRIADCTITGISSTHVDLERAGKAVVLVVGKQLALDGTGTISTASASDHTSSTSTAPPPAAGTSAEPGASAASAAPPAPAGDKAEVLRRMMERRQKEMSK